MVNVFSGGKAVNSAVKFANFYLLLEGNINPDVNVPSCFKAFLTHLKSKFVTGKGGDTAFKVLPDGSYFNAYPSIADTFKFFEEAIHVSNANVGGRPMTNTGTSGGRVATALSGSSKQGKSAAEGGVEVASMVFTIGLNCDGDNLFNKDPKDPNKYEIEGMKTQSTT